MVERKNKIFNFFSFLASLHIDFIYNALKNYYVIIMGYIEGNGKKIAIIFIVLSIIIGIGFYVFIHSNLQKSSNLKDKASLVDN